jgi:hypothetical protein
MDKKVILLYGFILGLVFAVVLLIIELPGKPVGVLRQE